MARKATIAFDGYVFVKHAGVHWKLYFDRDPKLYGVDRRASMHDSPLGVVLGIKDFYKSPEDALEDAAKLREENPAVSYGLCPILIHKK